MNKIYSKVPPKMQIVVILALLAQQQISILIYIIFVAKSQQHIKTYPLKSINV